MRRLGTLGAAVGALVLVVLGVPPTMSGASPAVDESLSIVEDSGVSLTGGYTDGTSIISFDARQSSPTETTVRLIVNGTEVTATRDVQDRTATWGASGEAMTERDVEAALGLYMQGLEAGWDEAVLPGRTFDGNRDLTLRLVMLLAEAPAGMPLPNQEINRPEQKVLDDTDPDPDVSGGLAVVTAHHAAHTCRAEVAAGTVDGSPQQQMGLAACQVANDNGIVYFPCTKKLRYLNHDANGHCFLSENVWTGPGSTDCMGECGPSCAGLNFYTQDCGDHDRCGRVHGGSTNPWDAECGDEYWDADDDFMLGWPQC